MKKIFAWSLVAAMLLCVCSACARPAEDRFEDETTDTTVASVITEHREGTTASDLPIAKQPSDEEVCRKLQTASDILKENGAMGGGSCLLNREYNDETYNLAYLRRVRQDDPVILSGDTLDNWIDDVFLKQSAAEQNALPTLYQAIRYFDIPKASLVALNDSRRAAGSDMVLPNDLIDALYLSETEMKAALVHPLALYYNGQIYTWEALHAATASEAAPTASFAVTAEIPSAVLDAYIDQVMTYCGAQGIITGNAVARFFGTAAQ